MAACLEICGGPKAKLAKLSCPFTWDLMDITLKHYVHKQSANKFNDNDNLDELSNSIPTIEFIRQLQKCYINVLSADLDSAGKNIQEASRIWFDQLEDNDDIPTRAFEHILCATKCYFFYENNEEENLNSALKEVSNVSDFSKEELGALEGCKSLAYSKYNSFAIKEEIAAATKAVEQNGKNALWHLVLAKALRLQRRQISVQSSPTPIEKKHFESAYRICKHPVFVIHYAQMLNETLYNSSNQKSNQKKDLKSDVQKRILPLYNEVFKSGTQDYKILLKLALGYIRMYRQEEMIRAHICLDTVDKIHPNHPISLHYRGLIYKACGEYKDALKCFKEAADRGNITAEFNYVEYGWEIGVLDPVEHLLNVVERYKHIAKEKKQEILLHIATCYYVFRNDIEKAGEYYLKAIKMHSKSRKLNCFYRFSHFYATNGIRNFLKVIFLPKMKRKLEENGGVYNTNSSLLALFLQLNVACVERNDIIDSLESISIEE